MQRNKIFIYFIVLIFLINLTIPVYADDEIEETSLTNDEISELMQASTELEEIPTINSKNAVIYDRISRKSYIWKTRKYKM